MSDGNEGKPYKRDFFGDIEYSLNEAKAESPEGDWSRSIDHLVHMHDEWPTTPEENEAIAEAIAEIARVHPCYTEQALKALAAWGEEGRFAPRAEPAPEAPQP